MCVFQKMVIFGDYSGRLLSADATRARLPFPVSVIKTSKRRGRSESAATADDEGKIDIPGAPCDEAK